eukprot:gene13792-9875_t
MMGHVPVLIVALLRHGPPVLNWNRSAPVWQYLEALSTVLKSASSSLVSLLTNTSVLSRTLTFANGDTQVSLTVASLL